MNWYCQPFGIDSDFSNAPYFSPDAKYVFLPLQTGIGMCSVCSGQWIRRFCVADMIVSFLSKLNQNILCAITKQRQIYNFDIMSGNCTVVDIDAKNNGLAKFCNGYVSRNGKVIVAAQQYQSFSLELVCFDDKRVYVQKLFDLPCEPNNIFVSDMKDPFYFCLLKNNIFISFTSAGICSTSSVREWNEPLYCGFPIVIALHPNSECVAIGWSSGKITLFFDFLQDHQKAIVKTLHWHSHALQAICFSSEGSFLYSGGLENVFVRWDLETSLRSYIPRLKVPIKGIACAKYHCTICIRHSDNSIKFVNENLVVEKSLYLPHSFSQDYLNKTPIIIHIPATNNLLMNTYPGHLQFVNVKNESLCHQFDITNENHVKCADVKPNMLQIECACVCSQGRWLACSIVRNTADPLVPYRELRIFRIGKVDKVLRDIVNIKSNYNPKISINTFSFCRYKLSSQQIPYLYACTSQSSIVRWEFDVKEDSECNSIGSNITVICKSSEMLSLANTGQPVSISVISYDYGVCAYSAAIIKFSSNYPSSIIDEYPVLQNDPLRHIQPLDQENLYFSIHKFSFTLWNFKNNIKVLKQEILTSTIEHFSFSAKNIMFYFENKNKSIHRFDINEWKGELIYSSHKLCNILAVCAYHVDDVDEELLLIVNNEGGLHKIQKSKVDEMKSTILEEDVGSTSSRLSAILNNQIFISNETTDMPNEMKHNEVIESSIKELSNVQTFLMPPIQSFTSCFLNSLITPNNQKFYTSVLHATQINNLSQTSKLLPLPMQENSDILSDFTFEQLLDADNELSN